MTVAHLYRLTLSLNLNRPTEASSSVRLGHVASPVNARAFSRGSWCEVLAAASARELGWDFGV
jgi:hypothetical protein